MQPFSPHTSHLTPAISSQSSCLLQTQSESAVPVLINCWPSASGGESYVNIEYESTVSFDLHNVVITIPIPTSGAPRINQVMHTATT